MSATEEREIEIVAGTIGGITQKKADTWTVAVTPEGSQYSKNLWTKDVELVESLSTKIGQAGAFVTSASYWQRQDGQQVRSLWIQQAADPAELDIPAENLGGVQLPTGSVATPAAAPQPGGIRAGGTGALPAASKDRLIVRQTCIKAAAELYAGQGYWSLTGDSSDLADTPKAIMEAAARFERWVTLGILEPIPFD